MAGCENCASKDRCTTAQKDACPSNDGPAGRQGGNGAEEAGLPKASFLEQHHELARIKSVIGVCSGKGGVGKSLVTSILAVMLARKGLVVGIMDADVTGPSIPKIFGLRGKIKGSQDGIFPASTHNGIQVVSVNLLLDDTDAPVIWRGPVIAGLVKQFWTAVIWDGLDVLLLDMPPGTGDVPLTIFQSIPLDGILIVTTPQELVSMIVKKARNMASMMGVKVFGLIENMSYVVCPGCGDTRYELFGKGKTVEAAIAMEVPFLDRIPVDPAIAELCDSGRIEDISGEFLEATVELLAKYINDKEEE
jgi:Mrp family chromosome partitioning ATPase